MMEKNVGELSCRKRASLALLFLAASAIPSPAQTFTTLVSFNNRTNGEPILELSYGQGGLVQGTDGNLYGTTGEGGANDDGTVFKIAPEGTLTTLYSFSGSPDGIGPYAALIQATDGNFYGTTSGGGARGSGTVFKVTPGGSLTTLYSFDLATGDGIQPSAGLIQATDGNFYGTTVTGGAHGHGTVFKITPAGTMTTLYSFGSATGDGSQARAGLIQAVDGDFYGTTETGGGTHDSGTVFKITPGGALSTLYSFGGTSTYGAGPLAGLIQATDGNLYGTTSEGGPSSYGTIFKITTGGTLATLYSFSLTDDGALPDGGYPESALVQAADGKLYGTTVTGGASDEGTVFSLTIPAAPARAVDHFRRHCAGIQHSDDDPAGLVYFDLWHESRRRVHSIEGEPPDHSREYQRHHRRQTRVPVFRQPDSDQPSGSGRYSDRHRSGRRNDGEWQRHFRCDSGKFRTVVQSARRPQESRRRNYPPQRRNV